MYPENAMGDKTRYLLRTLRHCPVMYRSVL
nr:MAG TPA: hypothetical protein [Caudoviricetes sp.]